MLLDELLNGLCLAMGHEEGFNHRNEVCLFVLTKKKFPEIGTPLRILELAPSGCHKCLVGLPTKPF